MLKIFFNKKYSNCLLVLWNGFVVRIQHMTTLPTVNISRADAIRLAEAFPVEPFEPFTWGGSKFPPPCEFDVEAFNDFQMSD